MMNHRHKNSRFCLGLVLQIFESLECGDIPAETARLWYQPYRLTLYDVFILEITGVVNDPKCNATTKRIGGSIDRTMERKDVTPFEADDISRAFSEMVNRGWHAEAVEFLMKFILENLDYNEYHQLSPGYLSHKLWLPFFGYVLDLYRDGDNLEWQRIDPIFGDSLLGVVVIYAAGIIGREPKKSVLRRAALRETCNCYSCRIINNFLLDGQKTRQIFKIVEPQRGRRSRGDEAFRVSRSALRHITRQLGHADRDCAVHVYEKTAAGPALVLQKRDNQWEWDKWKKRRAEGRAELMQVVRTKYFQDIVGCEVQYEEWKELKFLERGASKVEIPFVVEHPQRDFKRTLRDAMNIAGRLLQVLTRCQACITGREAKDEPEGATMWWIDRRPKPDWMAL